MQYTLFFSFLIFFSSLAQAKNYKLELNFDFSPPTVAKDSYKGSIGGHTAVFVDIEAPNLLQAQQQAQKMIGTKYTQDLRVSLKQKSKLCKCAALDSGGGCLIGDKTEDGVTYKNITVSEERMTRRSNCEAVISSAKIVGADLYEGNTPICRVGDSKTSGVAVCGSSSSSPTTNSDNSGRR